MLTHKLHSSGWDYLIGNSETAYNKVGSIVMGLKEVILEDKERKKEEKKDWKLFLLRCLANILQVTSLLLSFFFILMTMQYF